MELIRRRLCFHSNSLKRTPSPPQNFFFFLDTYRINWMRYLDNKSFLILFRTFRDRIFCHIERLMIGTLSNEDVLSFGIFCDRGV